MRASGVLSFALEEDEAVLVVVDAPVLGDGEARADPARGMLEPAGAPVELPDDGAVTKGGSGEATRLPVPTVRKRSSLPAPSRITPCSRNRPSAESITSDSSRAPSGSSSSLRRPRSADSQTSRPLRCFAYGIDCTRSRSCIGAVDRARGIPR